VRLSDVAAINAQVISASTPADTEIQYIDIASVRQTGCIDEPVRLAWADAPSRARRRVRQGDILVSTVRPYLRAFARVSRKPQNLVASTGFAVVTPLQRADGDFLYQHILSNEFVEYLVPQMTGTNYPAVSSEAVGRFELLFPPQRERQQIAQVLASIDDAIDRTETVIGRATEAKQALAHELLTRGLPGRHTRFKHTPAGEIPECWDVVQLGTLSTFITSGSRGWAKHYRTDGRAKFLRITNLKRSSIVPVLDDLQWADPPLDAEGRRTLVLPGDVLISITADLGATCIAPDDLGEAYVNQHLALVRLDPSRVVLRFAAHFLAGPGQAQFQRLMDQGAKAGLNLTSIRRLSLPLPPLGEQDTMMSALQAVESRIESELCQLARRREAKERLAHALLTGEVRVPVEVVL